MSDPASGPLSLREAVGPISVSKVNQFSEI